MATTSEDLWDQRGRMEQTAKEQEWCIACYGRPACYHWCPLKQEQDRTSKEPHE